MRGGGRRERGRGSQPAPDDVRLSVCIVLCTNRTRNSLAVRPTETLPRTRERGCKQVSTPVTCPRPRRGGGTGEGARQCDRRASTRARAPRRRRACVCDRRGWRLGAAAAHAPAARSSSSSRWSLPPLLRRRRSRCWACAPGRTRARSAAPPTRRRSRSRTTQARCDPARDPASLRSCNTHVARTHCATLSPLRSGGEAVPRPCRARAPFGRAARHSRLWSTHDAATAERAHFCPLARTRHLVFRGRPPLGGPARPP